MDNINIIRILHFFNCFKGELSLCDHFLLPQQEDPDVPGGVLHHHQAPHHKVQESQEEAAGQRVS